MEDMEDRPVVFEARTVSFLDLQFESEVLNVVIIAILTTMFAYQLSAICLNISLGSKKKGRATASDMHKLILAESSNPLAVLAAIARRDPIDRLRFGRDLPADARIARRHAKIKPLTILSLMVLLLVAPVFNLLSIFIVLPRDEISTFSDAKFGGLALTVNSKFLNSSSLVDFCDRLPIEVRGSATSLVQFTMCSEFEVELSIPETSTVRLLAESTSQGQIKVSVRSLPSDTPISAAFLVDLATDGQLLRTQPVFTSGHAARLVHNGQQRLAKYCSSAEIQNSPLDESLLERKESRGIISASKDFPCGMSNTRNYTDVLFEMTLEVNPSEQDAINVVKVEDIRNDAVPTYFNGGSLPFIARRTRAVNLILLLIMLCVSIIIRAITEVLFNNDVEEGVEAVVRSRLGVRPQLSLLRSSRTVVYNSKSQNGQIAHYGVRRASIPEVEHFNEGIEIGMEEDDEDDGRGMWS